MAKEFPKSEQTRRLILDAAVREFGQKGASGARTESIANTAGVNKALLHYYFKNKEGLYREVVDQVFRSGTEHFFRVLESGETEGESLLRFALEHFDRMVAHHDRQSLIHQEMMRIRQGKSDRASVVVERFMMPLFEKVKEVMDAGVSKGELCPIDPQRVVFSILGPNGFYSMNAQITHATGIANFFSSAAVATHRQSLMHFLGLALFVDRTHGQEVARKALLSMSKDEL